MKKDIWINTDKYETCTKDKGELDAVILPVSLCGCIDTVIPMTAM